MVVAASPSSGLSSSLPSYTFQAILNAVCLILIGLLIQASSENQFVKTNMMWIIAGFVALVGQNILSFVKRDTIGSYILAPTTIIYFLSLFILGLFIFAQNRSGVIFT